MENPYQQYQSHQSENQVFQSKQGVTGVIATSNAQASLYASKGWVRFISVLAYIYFTLMVLVTLGTIFSMGVGGSLLMTLIFLLMTVVIFLLANSLSRYASAIARTEMSRHPADLESAVIYQMKFWRLTGVLVLIGLLMAILGMVAPALIMR